MHVQQTAILSHGISGVSTQIHNHLVRFGHIGEYRARLIFWLVMNFDGGGKGSPHQMQDLFDYGGKANQAALPRGLPAKGKDLAHQ